MASSESMEVDQIEETEDQTDGPAWSELPSPAVEKVYSFLERRDRISMSLVCRNWHREYSSPSLWREMTYCFLGCKHETGMCPNVLFARRFGAWFHHVKIVLPSTVDVEEPSKAMSWLKLFLEALACQSQLLSISFREMRYYSRLQTDEFKADFYKMILNFIKSQKRLQSFEIFFGFRYDQKILKALFVNNYKTLRCLRIPTYLYDPLDESDSTVDDDLNFLVFMNLEELEIDYTPMLERMVLSIYEYRNNVGISRRKGRLKKLTLFGFYEGQDNVIRPPIWRYLREIFPSLKIDLTLISPSDSRHWSTFIVSEMPLIALYFINVSNTGHDNEVGILLRLITSCDCRRSLEVLQISWEGTSTTNIAPDLINLTDACPELKTLRLHLACPVVGLDAVSWQENRPVSLRTVSILLDLREPITQEEEMIYRSLRELHEHISPLLQPLKISLLTL